MLPQDPSILRLPFAVFIAASVFVPSGAEAFVCLRTDSDVPQLDLQVGPSLTWTTRRVSMVVSARFVEGLLDNPDDALEAVIASAQAWNEVPCSDFEIVIEEVDPNARAGRAAEGEAPNVVDFPEDWGDRDPLANGVTTHFFDSLTGHIIESDVVINPDVRHVDAEVACEPRRAEMDLANTLTHEFGHVVGLGHPPVQDDPSATMAFNARECETDKRDLASSDVEGICSIYPAGAATNPCFPPPPPTPEEEESSGCSHTSRGGASLLGWVIPFSIFALSRLVIRRRARRGLALLLFAGGTLWSTTARATVIHGASVEQLTRQSSMVVRGRITAARSGWVDREIVTEATLEVVDVWKGPSGLRTLRVWRRGGEVEGVGMHVDGEAPLPVGSELILFLRASKRGGGFWVSGMAQGVFFVEGAWAGRRLEGLHILGPATPLPSSMLVDSLRERVRGALERVSDQ